jgi:hypothetical protein
MFLYYNNVTSVITRLAPLVFDYTPPNNNTTINMSCMDTVSGSSIGSLFYSIVADDAYITLPNLLFYNLKRVSNKHGK